MKLERGSSMKSIIGNVNKHIFERIISLFNTLMLIFYDTCTFEWEEASETLFVTKPNLKLKGTQSTTRDTEI